jgi:CheY-like chemotaxis protein
LLKGLLAHSGFRLLEAKGGNEGIRLAREAKPRLIILDLGMPDLSGFEVLDLLKRDEFTREIPVVIHTSQVLDGEKRSLLQAAIDIIPKQQNSRELTEARLMEAFARAGMAMRPDSEVRV